MENFKHGISFVIPAKNEEASISITIDTIKKHASEIDYEIVVINHNSSDLTGDVAESLGARVLNKVGGTIGAARNLGAKNSQFDTLIFVDADVSLSKEWRQEIVFVLEKIKTNYFYMTGSHCIPPKDGSWLERYWFSSFSQDVKTTHLGTGHMIMSRKLFDAVGGFNEDLRTGEDYDICQRAKAIGAVLENNPKLLVVHRDYPHNLVDFFKREQWHGKGDAQSLGAFFSSKVAILSLVHVILHIVFLASFFFDTGYLTKVGLFASLFFVPLIAAKYKFRKIRPIVFLINTCVFYVYFFARFSSVIK